MTKTILITAGSKRIGAHMVSSLRQLGHRVIFTYHTTPSDDQDAHKLDLSNPSEINAFWEALGTKIDVLINNASHFQIDDLQDLSPNSLEKHMAVNFKAPILMSQKLAMQTEDGIVINMLDKWAKTYPKKFLSYALSKNGLESFTHYLNQNHQPKIRAYGIELGFTLHNENFPLSFFNAHKDLYPTSLMQLTSILDFLISGDKVATDIIDAGTWK